MGGVIRSTLDSILAWRLRTPFYYGWLVLGIAGCATFVGSGVSQVVLGGIQVYITEDTGWTKSTVSFAAAAGTWSSGVFALLIGRLADRYGPRWLMPVGLIVVGAGFLALSGVTSVAQFYVSYILARAVSQAVLIGLVPQLLGHTSLNWALGHLSATLVAVAVMAEPVGATLRAWLVLCGAPPPASVAGGGLVLTGVYLAFRSPSAAWGGW